MGMFCAIAEERIRGDYATKCRELTVTDIYIYIYIYIQRRDDNALRLLASPYGSATNDEKLLMILDEGCQHRPILQIILEMWIARFN